MRVRVTWSGEPSRPAQGEAGNRVGDREGNCGLSAASLRSADGMGIVLHSTNFSPEENGPTRILRELYPNGMNGLYRASEGRQCKGWTMVDAVTSCPDIPLGTKAFISTAGRSVSYWWLMANPSWRITLRWKELLLWRLCPTRRGSPYPMIGLGGDTKMWEATYCLH